MNLLRLILGIVAILLGAFMALGFSLSLADPRSSGVQIADMVLLIVFVVLPLCGGGYLIHRARMSPEALAAEARPRASGNTGPAPAPTARLPRRSRNLPVAGRMLLYLTVTGAAAAMLATSGWMGYLTFNMANDVWRARAWVPVEATIERAGVFSRHEARRMTHHEADLLYRYEWQGETYTGRRLVFTGDPDNFSADIWDADWLHRQVEDIELRRATGKALTVYVNPANPTESVIDRAMVWADYLTAWILLWFSALVVILAGMALGATLPLRSPPKNALAALLVVLALLVFALPILGAMAGIAA